MSYQSLLLFSRDLESLFFAASRTLPANWICSLRSTASLLPASSP
ncbi:hypothetical protein [Clostridium sp.]|nr:hypothetical protein [Clostridium sp.]MDU5107486.1 hypothetical protein [Clostridium sp.]